MYVTHENIRHPILTSNNTSQPITNTSTELLCYRFPPTSCTRGESWLAMSAALPLLRAPLGSRRSRAATPLTAPVATIKPREPIENQLRRSTSGIRRSGDRHHTAAWSVHIAKQTHAPSEGYYAMIGMMTTGLGLGLALYVSLVAYNQGGLFSWHPFLMSTGALGLSTAGIQAVRSRHAVSGIQPKSQRVQVRAI